MFWMATFGLAALYCLVRGAWDIRQKRYIWGAIGLLSGVALVLMPIKSHAIKMTLPG